MSLSRSRENTSIRHQENNEGMMLMAREYFCCYHSYLEAMEQLNDAERGRLFTACLTYSKTGEAPELRGNERFVFPAFRSQIDRDNANYEEKCRKQSANARKRWDAAACDGMPTDAKHAKTKEKEKEKEKAKEKEKEKGKEKVASCDAPSSRFVPPTVEEVMEYCLERQNGIDAQAFVDFYASKNWMVGKTKMSNWKASVRTWEQRRKQEGGNAGGSNAGNTGGSGQTQRYGTYL
jgi:hypothetical protein